jgi:hypothetical protein
MACVSNTTAKGTRFGASPFSDKIGRRQTSATCHYEDKKTTVVVGFTIQKDCSFPILIQSAKIGKKYIQSPEKIPFRGLFFSTQVVDNDLHF